MENKLKLSSKMRLKRIAACAEVLCDSSRGADSLQAPAMLLGLLELMGLEHQLPVRAVQGHCSVAASTAGCVSCSPHCLRHGAVDR